MFNFPKPNLLEDSPLRALTITTLPMIVGITAYMSFNLVDSYFIGQLGTKQLAAIGFSFPIVVVLLNLAIGLSIGTTSVLSRLLGEKKEQQCRAVTTLSIYFAALCSLVITIIGILTIKPLFTFLGADIESINLIKDYMFYAYIAMGVRMTSISVSSIFKATGNTFVPSISILLTSVLNFILDPLLIFGTGPLLK